MQQSTIWLYKYSSHRFTIIEIAVYNNETLYIGNLMLGENGYQTGSSIPKDFEIDYCFLRNLNMLFIYC